MVRRDEVLVHRDTTAHGAGDTPDSDVTAYRRIGERSSHTWFVLHEIPGYERVDGPWTGCGIPVGVPVER